MGLYICDYLSSKCLNSNGVITFDLVVKSYQIWGQHVIIACPIRGQVLALLASTFGHESEVEHIGTLISNVRSNLENKDPDKHLVHLVQSPLFIY